MYLCVTWEDSARSSQHDRHNEYQVSTVDVTQSFRHEMRMSTRNRAVEWMTLVWLLPILHPSAQDFTPYACRRCDSPLATLQWPQNDTGCSGNIADTCKPTCDKFATRASCQGFRAAGPPKLFTQHNGFYRGILGVQPTGLDVQWCCPDGNTSGLIGFRVKIIDTENNMLWVYDMKRDLTRFSFRIRLGASTHESYCSKSPKSHCVKFPVLSMNNNGQFYVQPNARQNLTVQVISLPIADTASDDLGNGQGVAQTISVPSCRELGCNTRHRVDCPEDDRTCSNFTQICFCVPQKPCIFPLELPGNHSNVTVTWATHDEHVRASYFRVAIVYADWRRQYNVTASQVAQLNASVDYNACASLVRTEQQKGTRRYFQFVASLPDLEPGENVSVTIVPVLDRDECGVHDGEPNELLAMVPERVTGPPAVSIAKPSNIATFVSVGIMSLAVITLTLVLCLVRRRYAERKKVQEKMPLSVLERSKEKITETVPDFELIRECFIQTGVCPIMSKEYEMLYEAESVDGSRILFNLMKVVQRKGNDAFGVLMFSLRKEGYENLFNDIYAEIPDEIKRTVDSIIYPPIPPRISLDQLPLHQDDLGDWQSPSVYVSYSRYVKTGMSADRDVSYGKKSSPDDDVSYLVQMLQAHGIDVTVDSQHLSDMADNEPQWITEQMARAKYVVVVLDSAYPMNLRLEAQQAVMYNLDDNGYRRACQECRLLQGESYSGRRNFIIPVQFGSVARAPLDDVPMLLRSRTRYRLPHRFSFGHKDFQLLVCRILGRELYANVNGYYQRAENHQLLYPSVHSFQSPQATALVDYCANDDDQYKEFPAA